MRTATVMRNHLQHMRLTKSRLGFTGYILGISALVFVLTFATVLPARAAAVITEYPVPTSDANSANMTLGPDGALWFSELGAGKIGRAAPDGTVTEYALADANSQPRGITAGPDGALWFAQVSTIGRITTSGVITEYPLPSGPVSAQDIVAGPDGALWFTEWSTYKLGRITTSGTITEYPMPTQFGNATEARDITVGSDGALWYAVYGRGSIGRMTTSGVASEFTPTDQNLQSPYAITSGPDGALWFTSQNNGSIGRLTTSGSFTSYASGAPNQVSAIVSGSDGALWFTDTVGNRIGRMTTSGVTTLYTVPTAHTSPYGIASATNGDIWFTEYFGNSVGKLHMSTPPAAPTNLTAPSPTNQSPVLSWSTAANATSYNVYRDGSLLTNTTSTTYTDTTAAEGTHSYNVTAVNTDGESSPSNSVNVLLDKTAPVVTVTPVAGSTLSGTVSFTITVSDNNPLDSSKNKSIWVYMYNTAAGQKSWGAKVDLSSGTGTFTIDTTKLNNGNANLDVGKLYDAAGNASGAGDTYFRNYTINN